MTNALPWHLISRTVPAILGAAVLLVPLRASAQRSFRDRFLAHNDKMSLLQPSWPTPLVEPDPRLTQYYRFSVSEEFSSSGNHVVNFGNNHGGGIIVGTRCEFDFYPPSYIEHNSSDKDGMGDAELLMKYRLISGNDKHGNFILTAIVGHSFATGSYTNGAATDMWSPTVAGGVGFLKRFNAESSLGGNLPTGKVALQGRSIAWNSLVMLHTTNESWLEIENNASFYFSGTHDGMMQNLVTPAAFYHLRSKNWTPAHPSLVFDLGMQIASSSFHTYNHNLISEVRLLF